MSTVRDLSLTADHDIGLVGDDLGLVRDGLAVKQSVDIHLQFFAGEWFLDLSAGIPWFQEILIKNPNVPAITEVFRAKILAVAGVAEVTQLGVDYTPATRTLRINWRATTDLSELIESSVEVTV